MTFRGAEDPHDRNGNLAYYWYREAENYSRSAEEMAADVRRGHLAAALAG